MASDDVATLVARASGGEQQAWDDIVDRFTNLLWSVGRAHRLDTVDIIDVIQTTWLRLLENIASIREPERLAGWLATTARRECLRELRRTGREPLGWDDAADSLPDLAPTVEDVMLLAERDTALWRCFAQLSDRCQRLLRVLMATEPPSYAEVSAALDLPIGSIGPTRMRCLRDLRALTQEYPFDSAGRVN